MAYAASTTFGSLKAKISKKLIDANNTAITVTDVADAVNDALHYWKQKIFWFNQGQTTITMDQSDPYVLAYGATPPALFPNAPVLPQNFLYEMHKDGFVIQYSNESYRFEKVNPAKYDDEYQSNGNGMPYIYCFRNGNFEFYYLPQLPYAMTVNYVCDYPDLVNDVDVNPFLQYADRMIMYEALSHLLGENRQDTEQDALYAGKADREYKLLLKRSAATVASGTLSTRNILN